ncbi:ABC-type multidrug transport system fused ATPase/permease subunit [Paenibacillus harenae]|nr:ABC-type multidrug transport system fused ATPase/permease subunit [Paenibacillus harenae]
MSMLRNITADNPRSLIKPVFYTTVANLAGVIPFALLVEAVRFFNPFVHPDIQLDTARLWWVCGGLAVSLVLLFACENPAYRAQYRDAYSAAADGRSRLAEHLRKLSLGYLNRRDPGDLANMMVGDFAMLEHGISHLVPQMIGAAVMPVLALIGLSFLDWRLALSLFAALPVAILLVLLTSGIQRKLGSQQTRAKIDASNRLQEYLNGIRVIKAYNLTGERFVRLELSFRVLMRKSIRLEGNIGADCTERGCLCSCRCYPDGHSSASRRKPGCYHVRSLPNHRNPNFRSADDSARRLCAVSLFRAGGRTYRAALTGAGHARRAAAPCRS